MTDFKSLMDPAYDMLFIEISNKFGQYDHSLGYHKAPAAAQNVARITKDVYEIYIGHCIRMKLQEEKKN